MISGKETDEKTCHGCEKSTTKSRASPPKELALREAQKLLYQMASTTQVLTVFSDPDKIHYVNTPIWATTRENVPSDNFFNIRETCLI